MGGPAGHGGVGGHGPERLVDQSHNLVTAVAQRHDDNSFVTCGIGCPPGGLKDCGSLSFSVVVFVTGRGGLHDPAYDAQRSVRPAVMTTYSYPENAVENNA